MIQKCELFFFFFFFKKKKKYLHVVHGTNVMLHTYATS